MSPADRPAIAEVRAGDQILAADHRLPFVVVVRHISIGQGRRTLALEVPGMPQCTWPVTYEDAEIVERLALAGAAA